MERRCKFWLPKKNRFCANVPLNNNSNSNSNSKFCGNHTTRSDDRWIACPIDPSHTVLEENLQGHLKKCPLLKHINSLSLQPFYQKGINAGTDDEQLEEENLAPLKNNPSSGPSATITSEMKRNAVYTLTSTQLSNLITKIQSVHASICKDIQHSFNIPEACGVWTNRQVDGKLPFQEKHVLQQASILGNLEEFGILKNFGRHTSSGNIPSDGLSGDDDDHVPAVVEFGAGRGYLTQMLADCYGIKKVFLVERKSYKLKADRSLRQKDSLILERLRIDIEDLNLNAVESLHGIPYLATGKHLCGPATDMTLRCCLAKKCKRCNAAQHRAGCNLRGLAIATCCHHLCQWKHYINKRYLSNLGITREDFNAITWFTSWAVDADHSSDPRGNLDLASDLPLIGMEEDGKVARRVEDILREMKAVERAVLGFMCKDVIDMGRLMWIKEHGLEAQLVKYVPSNISPENHLLIARG